MADYLVAKLDAKRCLVGTTRKAKPGKADVVLPENCDLALDGSYKWDGKKFVPLGHGFGPVVDMPVTTEAALYALIASRGFEVADEASEWAAWYEKHLKARDAELAVARRKRQARGRK